MRKQHLLSLFLFLTFGVSLTAQEKVIVLTTLGKVEYLPDRQSQPSRVTPGQELPSKGFIKFVDGGMTKLLLKGQPELLDKGGIYDLESLLREKSDRRQLNFISRFWRFVTEGVTSANDDKSLERYHEKYMTRSGGIKGWAKGEYGLAANVLIRGALVGQYVTFNWNAEADVSAYDLFIYRQSDDMLAFKASTPDTVFTLDFDQLYLNPGTAYYWMVTPHQEDMPLPTNSTAPAQRSAALTFTFAPQALEETLAFHFEDPVYLNSTPEEQMLIEAYLLEDSGLFYDAGRRYERLLQAYPEDQLLRKLYASFLARQGILEKAATFLK